MVSNAPELRDYNRVQRNQAADDVCSNFVDDMKNVKIEAMLPTNCANKQRQPQPQPCPRPIFLGSSHHGRHLCWR